MKITTFSAFGSRNYRLFFSGQSVSLIGTWMQKTAVSWIVYSLTHSSLMLGLSLLVSQLPSFLFSLVGGVVSDRYNRYRVLLGTQIASMIQAIALALLVLFVHYTVWEIFALSAVLGIINAFDVPARQALVYERSFLSSIISYTRACRAGTSKALIIPSTALSVNISHTV